MESVGPREAPVQLLGHLHGSVPLVVEPEARTISGGFTPEAWRLAIEPIAEESAQITVSMVEAELLKYPRTMFPNELALHVASQLRIDEQAGTGIAEPTEIMIAVGERPDQMSGYLSWAVHNQMAVWIFRAHRDQFPEAEWLKAAPNGSDGQSEIAPPAAGDDPNAIGLALLERGYLAPSSQGDIEDDFKCYVASLFMNDHQFWRACDRFEVVGKKAKLAMGLLQEIHPGLTEAYFRSLPRFHESGEEHAALSGSGDEGPPVSFDVDAIARDPDSPGTLTTGKTPPSYPLTWKGWLESEMRKYPGEIFQGGLTVYCAASVALEDVSVGGTFWLRGALVAAPPVSTARSRTGVAETLHHEVVTWLGKRYWPPFDRDEWVAALPAGFTYSEDALEAIRDRPTELARFDPSLSADGFLNEYSKTTFQNDFAEIGAALFLNRPAFWHTVDSEQRLRRKVSLIIDFLQSIHPQFNEEYFRSLPTTAG